MTTPSEATAILQTKLNAANPGPPRVDIFVGEPDPETDKDGRARPYIVLHPSPGVNVRIEEPLTTDPGPRLWRCQATCAGGDVARALRALERLQAVVVGKPLTPTSGTVREEGDLGPVRPDLEVTPNRWFVPVDLVVEL